MADGIQQATQKIAEQIAEQAAENKQGTGAQEPDSGDVAKFENAMQKQGAEGAGEVSGEASTQVAQTEATGDPKGMGDTILEKMDQLKGSHEEKEKAINELLSKSGDEPMSSQDVMRLQYELSQLHLQTEVTTKAADKSSQGVQTLFKNQ